jgi:hypothetical protein
MMLVPLLLILVSALVLACVVMYNHARQVESVSHARDALFMDELRRAQTGEGTDQSAPVLYSLSGRGAAAPWRDRALLFSVQGWDAPSIAREVGATTSEVELILALG